MSENFIKELSKLLALQRLCMEIAGHIIGRTVLDVDVSLLDLVCEEKIANVLRSGSLP
jgi:hypothetical protein